MPRVSLKILFVVTALIAGLFGVISKEPMAVGFATLFCLGSFVGIASLIWFTTRHLAKTCFAVIVQRSLGPLARRIRWLQIDLVIAVWMLTTIVVSNFVLENSVAAAKWGIYFGWVVGPMVVAAILIWRQRKKATDLHGCSQIQFSKSLCKSAGKPVADKP